MNLRVPTICLSGWLAVVMLGGCLQVDTRIVLNPDGGATVTEKLRFSQRLLDLDADAPPEQRVAPLLTEQAFRERMEHMGEGVTLASHSVVNVEQGARESVAVLQVADLNGFQYASPFLAYADSAENCIVKCSMVPLYKSRNYVGIAGEMAISFNPLKRPRNQPAPDKDAPPKPGPSPLQLQMFRQLLPMLADMLKGFKLRMTFQSYGPIRATCFGLRGRRASVHEADLMNFTDHDLDQFGDRLLENEEVMLELAQQQFHAKNLVEAVRHFQDNMTVPVFLAWGSPHATWRPGNELYVAPSRQLFDKHFAGKKLDFDRWQSSGKNIRPARFEDIGYQPPAGKKGATENHKPASPGKADK